MSSSSRGLVSARAPNLNPDWADQSHRRTASATSAGSSGVSARVRFCLRDCRRPLAMEVFFDSWGETGHGATHGPHRAGSSCDHYARSRYLPRTSNRMEWISRHA
jgi:hypothetical protein